MANSIAKNYLYNILLQLATLALPLITTPYVSRVLGSDGVGTYSYTFAITQYFIIIGTIGLTLYGSRQIAYTRDSKEKMSKAFWSLLFLRFITTGLALLMFLAVFGKNKTYGEIYVIQSILILSALIDISWLYIGLEDFKKTVTRNIMVKIIGVCLIFVFVKDINDLKLYTLINGLMIFLGNAVMWMYLPKTVSWFKISFSDIWEHVVPAIHLFIPQIAIQVYFVLDKSMIGLLSSIDEVGLYTQSEKIVKVGLSLITALGTVMAPRMSNLFAQGRNESMIKYLNTSLQGTAYAAIPMCIGVVAIAKEFVPWFLGPGFEGSTMLMIILSPVVFSIALSNVMGMQFLLPSDRSKEFTISVIAGAVINFVLNLILIPFYKAFGACIATVVAEFCVTLIQYSFLRKEINIKLIFKSMIKYSVSAIVMYAVVRYIGISLGAGAFTTVIQCLSGGIVYLVILKIMRESVNEKLYNLALLNFKKICRI